MKDILSYLFEHKTLSYEKSKDVLRNIASGEFSDAEIAAFLSVFIMRSIKVEELTGFRDALLELCKQIDFSGFETIDLCGTGGDGKSTFNISTAASFIVAGAGYKVAKHGNYGVSSSCGSSNVLEFVGYKFGNNQDQLKMEIDKAGICFLHAPLFHPAMKAVGPVRRSLRIKTFFNMLGPMVNPSFPKYQIVGVFSLELARLYQYLYQQSDKKYHIIHSLDGYDEISLTGPVKIISNTYEQILNPEELGFNTYTPEELAGGSTVESSAKVFLDLLQGKGTKTQEDVVVVNAAYAIRCFNLDKTLEECIEEAKQSLNSGKAYKALARLLEVNQKQ